MLSLNLECAFLFDGVQFEFDKNLDESRDCPPTWLPLIILNLVVCVMEFLVAGIGGQPDLANRAERRRERASHLLKFPKLQQQNCRRRLAIRN